MRLTPSGLALLFASSLLASSASAGFSGHSGGFAFFPSGHPGAFGHFGAFGHPGAFGSFGHPGSFGPYAHIEVHRGFDAAGGRVSYVSRRGNFGHGMGVHNWYYGGSDLGYFAPQILYFDPVTTQETTYPPLTVISAPGYVPDAPAQEVVSSGPRIIMIGAEPTGPLPRVIYGTTGAYASR
jgi:hypothetical protein